MSGHGLESTHVTYSRDPFKAHTSFVRYGAWRLPDVTQTSSTIVSAIGRCKLHTVWGLPLEFPVGSDLHSEEHSSADKHEAEDVV